MSETRPEFRPGDSYTCARCGGEFVTDWTSEEATDEARGTFTESEVNAPQAIVCDDCYQQVMAWYRRTMS